jgi:hypothetical protein
MDFYEQQGGCFPQAAIRSGITTEARSASFTPPDSTLRSYPRTSHLKDER